MGQVEASTGIAVIGAPALYITGNLLFKQAITGRWPLSHLIGIALLVLVAMLVPFATR